MEINYVVRVSARMDFFLTRQNNSSFIANCLFSNNEAPESDI